MPDPGELTLALFADRIGESFGLAVSDEVVLELTLAEAEAIGDGPADGGREPFSIIFGGPVDAIAPQGIYRIEHETIGTAEIFLVPLEPAGSRARYQAIFT